MLPLVLVFRRRVTMSSHRSTPRDVGSSSAGQASRVPCEPDEIDRDELERLRSLSSEERGRQLAMACRAAVRLDRSRAAAGLPPPVEEPWPESTWEFLRKHARRHAKS